MTLDQHPGSSDSSIESALAMTASLEWADRAEGIRLLATHFTDPRASAQIVRGLGDLDTAVVAEATGVLVRAGGVAGMRAALQQLALSDDDAGYHIRNRLVELWMDGYPVLDVIRGIVSEEPPGPVREGAYEMLDLLEGS